MAARKTLTALTLRTGIPPAPVAETEASYGHGS